MMNISYKNQLHYLWQFLILSVLIIWSLPLFAVESEVRRNDPSYWIPDTINFEFGFDRFRVNFSNEYPDASYIKNLIESWNWSSGPKLVTAKEACVYKDVSHNCTVSLTQGGMSRNGHNQIHFQWWPDDFPDWLAATKAQSVQGLAYITNLGEAPVYDDVDILMNNRDIDWITRDLIDYCIKNKKKAFLFETTLVHEIGHALGLPDTYTEYTRMRGEGSVCGEEFKIKPVFVTGIDKQNLHDLYGPLESVNVNIGFPYDNAVLFAGQPQTFNANSNTVNTSSSIEQAKSLIKTNSGSGTSTIVWASDQDGNLGSGDVITVDNLSVGSHLITATVGTEGSSEYGQDFVAVEVIGQSSTDYKDYLYPVPCTVSVESPQLGCKMKFTQRLYLPACNLPRATIRIENVNTGNVLATATLPSQSCPFDNLLVYEYSFNVTDPENLADIEVNFEVNDSGCGASGEACFSHTVRATVPIVQATIDITQVPSNCIIPAGALYCESHISWKNHYFAPNSTLFYKPLGGNGWVKIGNVGTEAGSYVIPGLVDSGDVEVAIFQYGTNGFGASTTPKGVMAGPFIVGGRRAEPGHFMGETVFSLPTSEDKDFDNWNVLDGGTTLNLFGNTWKAINYNYFVTADTWLEVDYKSEGPYPPEIAGVALLSSTNMLSDSTFQIDGTQTTFGNQWFNRYFDNGWKTYRINVGRVMKYLGSNQRNVHYLGFIGDIDASNQQINISYHNPRLFEESTTHHPQWGHSGYWYEPDTSGQGFALEVNPINKVVVMEWFTYAENGQGKGSSYNRWYLQTGSYNPADSAQDVVGLNIYQVTGGRFNRTDAPVKETIVGTAKLRFFDCYSAHIEYDFYSGINSGRNGYIPITRVTPNIDCSIDEYTGPHKSDFGYTGNWYNPPTSGQGFVFEMNPHAAVFAASWFTYLPSNSTNLSNPNRQRWFTLVGPYTPGTPNSNTLTIYKNTGGALDDPYPTQEAAIGTAHVVFSSCTTAKIYYNFTGGGEFAGLSGSIDLVRITSNVTCE